MNWLLLIAQLLPALVQLRRDRGSRDPFESGVEAFNTVVQTMVKSQERQHHEIVETSKPETSQEDLPQEWEEDTSI